jgi:hypothetical protein
MNVSCHGDDMFMCIIYVGGSYPPCRFYPPTPPPLLLLARVTVVGQCCLQGSTFLDFGKDIVRPSSGTYDWHPLVQVHHGLARHLS